MENLLTEVKGIIYNIQRFSLHDGPGIRTTVFLKGCPLRCLWCCNPESQSKDIEIMDSKEVGRIVSVGEIVDVVERDRVFYRYDGGMTLSGGEAVMQPDFASSLVKEAKKRGINVTVETTAFQQWDLLWKVIEDVDLVLMDIKAIDSSIHKKLVGVPNEIILENAKRIVSMGKKIIVRIPVIPDINDSWNNLLNTCLFSKNIGIKKIELLPYHFLGVPKYKKLSREYKLKEVKPPLKEELKKIAVKLQEYSNIKVSVV